MPRQGNVVVAFPEVFQHLLGFFVVRLEVGDDGLDAGGGFAGDVQRGGAHGDGLGVDGATVPDFPGLLDDGAGGELGLGDQVQGAGIGSEELLQLAAEVGDVGPVVLGGHDGPAALFELGDGGAADAFGVVGGLGDGGQGAYAVSPEGVSGVYPDVDVADLGAEDVVAGVGDVRVAGQAGEEDCPVGLGEGSCAEHSAAAGGAKDNLDSLDIGELVVGGDGLLGGALGVFDDQLKLSSVDAAFGVDFIGGHLLGLVGDGAVGLAGAGEGLHDADAEEGRVLAAAGAGQDDERGHQDRSEQAGGKREKLFQTGKTSQGKGAPAIHRWTATRIIAVKMTGWEDQSNRGAWFSPQGQGDGFVRMPRAIAL